MKYPIRFLSRRFTSATLTLFVLGILTALAPAQQNRFWEGGIDGSGDGVSWNDNDNWSNASGAGGTNHPNNYPERPIFDADNNSGHTPAGTPGDNSSWSNNNTINITQTGTINLTQMIFRDADAPMGETPHTLISVTGGGTINLEPDGQINGVNEVQGSLDTDRAIGSCDEPRTALNFANDAMWSDALFGGGPTGTGGYTTGVTAQDIAASGIYEIYFEQNFNLMEDQRWTIGVQTLTNNTGVDANMDGDTNDPGDIQPFTITAEGRFIADGVVGDSQLFPDGTGGPGATLWKDGGGKLQFAGMTSNTYTGLTVVDSGELELNKSNGATAIVGNLLGMGGRIENLQSDQINDTSHVLLENGSDWYLYENNETIANFGSLDRGGERLMLGSFLNTTSPDAATATANGIDTSAARNDQVDNATGAILSTGDSVLTFGADNQDNTFEGELGGNGDLVKTGTGIFTLGKWSNAVDEATVVRNNDLTDPANPVITTTRVAGDSEILIHIQDGVFQANGNFGQGDWETVMEDGTLLAGTGRLNGEIFIKDGAVFAPGKIETGDMATPGTYGQIYQDGEGSTLIDTGITPAVSPAVDHICTLPLDADTGGTGGTYPGGAGKGGTTGNPGNASEFLANEHNQLQQMRVGTVRILSGGTLEMQIMNPTFVDGTVASPTSNAHPDVAGVPVNGDYFGTNTSVTDSNANAIFDSNLPHDHLEFENGQDLHLVAGATIDVDPFDNVTGAAIWNGPAKGQVYVLFDINTAADGGETIIRNDFQVGWGGDGVAAPLRSGSQNHLFDLKLPDISPGSIWNPAGHTFYWDTSRFISDGILVIIPEPSRALLLALGLTSLFLRRQRA